MATGDRMGYKQQCDMLVLRSWSCPSKWTDFCTEPFLIWETKMVQPQRWGFWPANLGICGVKWCQMWKLKVANKCVWTCFEFDILVFLWWHCVPLGLDDWLWPSRPSYLWYPVAIQSQKFGSCCATGSWHEVVLFGPAAQWVHGWKFHSSGETMGPTGATHLGMSETGVYLQFVGTSTYHVFCFQSSSILIFGQKM